jgi:hypothetical protein
MTSPPSSPAVVNKSDDAFQSALDEAALQLMDDVDITTDDDDDDVALKEVAASFTIDEEDDDPVWNGAAEAESHPLAGLTVRTAAVDDDPLLSAAAQVVSPQLYAGGGTSNVSYNKSPSSGNVVQPTTPGGFAASADSYSNTATTPSSYYPPHPHPHPHLQQAPAAAAFQQQAKKIGSDAQRMAVNVLGMAQRAATQVLDSAIVHPTMNSAAYPSGFSNHHIPQSSSSLVQQHQQQAQQAQFQFQQQHQQSTPLPELDKAQKLQRLQAAVHLLQGEQVIMFLNSLWHVSDSTGTSYYANKMNTMHRQGSAHGSTAAVVSRKTVQLSCAMTFYRVIVFGHEEEVPDAADGGDQLSNNITPTTDAEIEEEAPQIPAGWNGSCWPKAAPAKLLMQIPLSSLERVEKSVFSTSNNGGISNNLPSTPTHSMSPSHSSQAMMAASTASTSMMGLVLTGKDNQRVIRITTASYQDTIRAHQALQTYAFPGRRNLGYLFAFESRRQEVVNSMAPPSESAQGASNSAPVVTCEPYRARFTMAEFQRQLAPGKHPWMVYPTLNHQYQLCASYPGYPLVGPATLNAESNPEAKRLLQQCAQFRSEYRLPLLTWSTGTDGGSLWRASQPKVGLQGNRSSADEMLLKHILEAAASANAMSHSANSLPSLSLSQIQALTGNNLQTDFMGGAGLPPTLKILDLRPRSAAIANKTGGYGYENTSNYAGTTLQFCGIDNIHKVRDAYQKLSAVCMSPNTSDLNWNALLEDTKWPSMIRLILAAGWEAAFWIHVYRFPVLVHCSHGWDRTSQVVAIAQLLLDPFYRTKEGFSTLVEKDFMSFGHPFHTRCAHGEGRGESGSSNVTGGSSVDEGQISPIFIQFLDCVFQLVNQYPECFEFNTKYLLVVSEHVYSCRFGNFLCDNERERELVAGIRQRTHSLWDYLDSRKDVTNRLFKSERADGVMLMPLPTLLRNVTLWADRHCMHGPKATLRWLPADMSPPGGDFESDQQASFITAHDVQSLLLTANPDDSRREQASSKAVGDDTFATDDISHI